MKYSMAVPTGVVATVVAGFLTGCSVAPSHADDGRSIANYFKVGDCFRDPLDGATSVTLVDCAELHAGEVYAIFMLPDGPYPGDGHAPEYKKQCGGVARSIVPPALVNDPTLKTTIRFPDGDTWAQGDRSVTCVLTSNPPRTGSIRNAG